MTNPKDMKYALRVAKAKAKMDIEAVSTSIPTAVADHLTANPPTATATWESVTDKPESFPPGTHSHPENAPAVHTHAYAPEVHTHSYEPANANIQSHISTPHAPAGAQANADITKAEIEAKLTGEISSHTHAGGGGDGEVSVVLTDDRSTTSTSLTAVTGLTFNALASSTYIIECFLVFQSNNVSYGIGYGITGPASPTFCVGHIDLMLAASTRALNNITGYGTVNSFSASVVAINTNYPGYLWAILRTGANAGPVTITHRSESASGTITTKAGSVLRYRKVA